MASRWVVVALIAGCAGQDPPRDIPDYDPGILLEGDCDVDDVVATDTFALSELYEIQLQYDPFLQIDENLPGAYGTIIETARKFEELLTELNFATTSRPLVDFETQQVGAVWYQERKSCGIEIEGAHVRTRADGSAVFDVELLDIRKNCADNCDQPSQALVIDVFSNEVEASICRRVRPGCPPGS